MEKVLKVIPLTLLTVAFIKTLVLADITSVVSLGILSLLYVAIEYKVSSKRLVKLEDSVADMSVKLAEMEKLVNEARSHAAALKLSQQKVSNLRF